MKIDGFWGSLPGKTIRWIGFLPVGLVASSILVFAAMALLGVVTGISSTPVMVVILLVLFPFFVFHLVLLTMSIQFSCFFCPKPRVGVILFLIYFACNFAFMFFAYQAQGVTLPHWWEIAISCTQYIAIAYGLLSAWSTNRN